jgi:hypothetical protein
MIDDTEVQQRLRRSMEAIAQQATPPRSSFWHEPLASPVHRDRRLVAFVSAAVVVTVVAAALVWVIRPSTPRVTTTDTRPSAQALSAHIELPLATMVAGSSETGYLVIENDTGAPLHLKDTSGLGCVPKWRVVLRNAKVPQQVAFPSDCSASPGPSTVATGQTKLPFTLEAAYQLCSPSGQPHGVLTPTCVRNRQEGGLSPAPPLPAGLYEATFSSNIAHFVSVAAVPVRVVTPTSSAISPAKVPGSSTSADATVALKRFLAQHPNAVVHSTPVTYTNKLEIAVVGIAPDPNHRAIYVLDLTNGTASPLATLTLPSPTYAFVQTPPITTADLTGDGLPDFLVRFLAADNAPGVVVSADSGTWTLVPQNSDPTSVYIGRDPTISNGHLDSTRNDCIPTCAQGHSTIIVWHYDRQHNTMVAQ